MVAMATAAVEDVTKEAIMTTTHNPNSHPMTSRKPKPVLKELPPLTHMPPTVVISSTWPCGIKPMGNNNRLAVRDRLQVLLNECSTTSHGFDSALVKYCAMMLACMIDICSFSDATVKHGLRCLAKG